MKRNVIVYRCRNCGGTEKVIKLPWVREFVLACTGQIEVVHLLRPFEEGETGVCVVHCEPSRCKTLSGCERALKRVGLASRLLEETGVSGERIFAMKGGSVEDIENGLRAFLKRIRQEKDSK